MRITVEDLAGATITHYPYRRAMVLGADAERVHYGSGDPEMQLLEALAAQGRTPEGRTVRATNHDVFQVVLADGSIVCVQFGDWDATFGSAIKVGRW